jgi:hypothetical protein
VPPEGWSVQPAKEGELLVVAPGPDSRVEILIESGTRVLAPERPATLDEVEQTVVARFIANGSVFSTRRKPVVDRIVLPIGAAVRLRLTSTTSFFFSYN